MRKTFVYLDLSSFIEVKLVDSYSKIKMQGWKILKISTCTTCPCVCKFNSLHLKQSKFLLVLQHKVPVMVSGRVDFSSSEMVWSKNVPTIWVNTQELNHGHKLLKGVFLFKPMEFSINFDTVKSGWSTINIERSAYNFLKIYCISLSED